MPEPTDPLGVLATTRAVVERAELVQIDRAAAARVAVDLACGERSPAAWDPTDHWQGQPERMANYLLVLDALNFCFWGDEPRWRVTIDGARLDGYRALAVALTRAMEAGVPLDAAAYLARITTDDLAHIFHGEGMIPLLPQRVDILGCA